MDILPTRRHVPHWEFPGGTVCVTWRLHRDQPRLVEAERELILEVIRRCEPEFGQLLAAVVMDDHAHVLVRPSQGITARRLASAWKGTTAHRLCGPGTRAAPLWQREYFDRWMRSADHTIACARYIIENPRRRWPDVTRYPWIIPAG